MNIIKISDVIFLAHLSGIAGEQQILGSVSYNNPELEGKSKVVENYKTQYTELQKVIKEYSILLDRDIDLMKESGEKIIEQDNMLGKLLGR